jgi:cysteine desulfurase
VFANPASAHRAGRRARQALEAAREQVAALLGADPDEVLFTSGATEANNLALFGLAGDPPGLLLASPVEHPSVSEPLAQLQRRGFRVEFLAVEAAGIVRLDTLPPLLAQAPRLITVMLANNETGAIQPVAELARQSAPAPFHCDAVQAAGKIPVNFHALGVTSLAISAHKFNGPRGVGALLVRRGSALRPLFWGGHQQHGLRPGTEPVVLAVGMAKALEIACREMDERTARVRALRDRFLSALRERAAPVVLNGPAEGGLPHTLNLSFPGCRAETLLMKLDFAGVACSAGSACSSGSLLPSPVLRAMGCPEEVLHSALRFSLSHLNTETEIARAVERIAAAVARLRAQAGEESDPPFHPPTASASR